jgi:hypothetical protein
MRSNAKPAMAQPPEGFSFVVPTEFVDLPSGGRYYPEGHPLCDKEVLEFKHMTAKEEDILTSKTLLKKGIAIDRVIRNVIVDKSIDPDSLLVGDRNALIIALRAASYGNEYQTNVTCPSCQNKTTYSFDLNDTTSYGGEDIEVMDVIERDDGTFEVELPATKITAIFKLLTGKEEKQYLKNVEESTKKKNGEKLVSQQLMAMLVSVNGDDRLQTRQYVSQNLPSMDSKHLRMAYKFANPNIDLTQNFECSNCGHEAEMEVPLSADFFWPQQ